MKYPDGKFHSRGTNIKTKVEKHYSLKRGNEKCENKKMSVLCRLPFWVALPSFYYLHNIAHKAVIKDMAKKRD